MKTTNLKKISDVIWELPKTGRMNVPVRLYSSSGLLKDMEEGVLEQASNCASLPGLVGNVFVMPDGHYGYGAPIGGVMAFEKKNGYISPGAIGFDVNCGMRLVKTNLTEKDLKNKGKMLLDSLFKNVPSGVGSGNTNLNIGQMMEVLSSGSKWCLDNGYAWKSDLENTEENGSMKGDPEKVSERAIKRGKKQLGSLGSGNHYLEVQIVDEENIIDNKLAEAFGLYPGQVVIMFHCGSRGLGHQIASDYLKLFIEETMPSNNIDIPDPELACGPFNSEDGQAYFNAMQCGVNFAFANRQLILHNIRKSFQEVMKKTPEEMEMEMIYDVAHNIGKIEKHKIDGKTRDLIIHRKGATRSFGPSFENHKLFKKTGQPVIIGGSMETGSYLLVGTDKSEDTFGTTAHGSGRKMSRHAAKKKGDGKEIQQRMEKRGILVKTDSYTGLAEEAGYAYKDIHQVVDTCVKSGINKAVVALRPILNVKG